MPSLCTCTRSPSPPTHSHRFSKGMALRVCASFLPLSSPRLLSRLSATSFGRVPSTLYERCIGPRPIGPAPLLPTTSSVIRCTVGRRNPSHQTQLSFPLRTPSSLSVVLCLLSALLLALLPSVSEFGVSVRSVVLPLPTLFSAALPRSPPPTQALSAPPASSFFSTYPAGSQFSPFEPPAPCVFPIPAIFSAMLSHSSISQDLAPRGFPAA